MAMASPIGVPSPERSVAAPCLRLQLVDFLRRDDALFLGDSGADSSAGGYLSLVGHIPVRAPQWPVAFAPRTGSGTAWTLGCGFTMADATLPPMYWANSIPRMAGASSWGLVRYFCRLMAMSLNSPWFLGMELTASVMSPRFKSLDPCASWTR